MGQKGVRASTGLVWVTGCLLLIACTRLQGATLNGIVYAFDGAPAAEAIVWAAPFDHHPRQMIQTRTHAEGRFSIELTAGPWTVRARLGSQGGEAGDRYGMLTIKDQRQPEPVTIRLAERGTLRGRLLEAETGAPIAGGHIWLDTGELVTADREGRYETGGLAQADHHLIALCPGRERRRILFDTSLRPDAELDIRLAKAGKITGRVLDEEGRPISAAWVWLPTSGHTINLAGFYEPCDAEGRFEWDGAAFDRPLRLQASAAGYADVCRRGFIVEPGAPPRHLVFELPGERPPPEAQSDPSSKAGTRPAPVVADEPRRRVRGIILSSEGKPLANVLVRWGATDYEETNRQTRSDAEGRFVLSRVPDRKGYFTVMAAGYAPIFEPVDGGGDVEVEVQLELGESIQGTVQDAAGRPLAGVTVVPVIRSPDPSLCNPYWLSERQAATDAAGKFRISGLPAGGAMFDFLRPDLSERRNQDVEDGDVITMEAGGAIRGRVVDEAGRPVRDFRILIDIPREYDRGEGVGGFFAGYDGIGISFTSSDGTFVVSDLVAGNIHRVTAVAQGHCQIAEDRVAALPITALPPAEKLTLTLGDPYKLRVQVVEQAESKRPVSGARLALVAGDENLDQSFRWGSDDASWNVVVRARSGPDGWAVFENLPFGEATLLVETAGFARHWQGWRSGEAELRIELGPQCAVTGLVAERDGIPVAECYVDLANATGDHFSVEIAPQDQGRFAFDGLPEGDYQLTVMRDRQTLYKDAFSLEAGGTYEFTSP